MATESMRYRATCGDCGESWYPGHPCVRVRQATKAEEAEMWRRWIPPIVETSDEAGREEAAAEGSDLAALYAAEGLAGRLWLDRRLTLAALNEVFEALAALAVAVTMPREWSAMDLLPDQERMSRRVSKPEDWEAL